MDDNNNGSNFASFLFGFLLGGVIGAMTALLMAPQSGEETRTLIKDKSIELKDQAGVYSEEWTKQAQEKAVDLQHKSQVVLEEQKTKIAAMRTTEDQAPVEEEIVEEEIVEEVTEVSEEDGGEG